jgi:hypothetical protein
MEITQTGIQTQIPMEVMATGNGLYFKSGGIEKHNIGQLTPLRCKYWRT